MINANEHGQTLAAFSSKTTVVNWRLQADNDPDARTVAQRVQYATMSLEEASQKWTQELHQTASELNQVSRELELKFAAKKSSSGKYVPPFSLWFSRTYMRLLALHVVGPFYSMTVALIFASTHLITSSCCLF
jgi:hypothetical protein